MNSVIIPDCVTSIGESAFNGCTGLTSVTIPNSVTYNSGYARDIEESAFANCSELTDFYCYAINIPDCRNIFENSYIEYATLHVPNASIEQYKADDHWGKFGKIVALTEEETSIGMLTIDKTNVEEQIFTPDGKLVETLQKGVNIIKYKNGTSKKVVVK